MEVLLYIVTIIPYRAYKEDTQMHTHDFSVCFPPVMLHDILATYTFNILVQSKPVFSYYFFSDQYSKNKPIVRINL